MSRFPALDQPASEILRRLTEKSLWVVRNERTFEPYFYDVSRKEYYLGDNDEVWAYIELINKLNTRYRANQKHEAVGSNQAA